MSRRNSGYFVSHPVNLLIHRRAREFPDDGRLFEMALEIDTQARARVSSATLACSRSRVRVA